MCSGGPSPQITYGISYCPIQIFGLWKNGLCIILLALVKTTFKGISRIQYFSKQVSNPLVSIQTEVLCWIFYTVQSLQSIKHIYHHFCKFIHLSFYKELLTFENTYKSIFITRKMPCLTTEIRVKADLPSSYWPQLTAKSETMMIPPGKHFHRAHCGNIFCQISLKADLK